MAKNSDEWLKDVRNSERGRLKIFLGYAAGVGKTYRMLEEAHALLGSGVDVVIGHVEDHGREETAQLIGGFEQIPEITHNSNHNRLAEMNVKAIIERHPEIVIVDELAHTNTNSWNKKRYQDIYEILTAGISVYTTVNIQHIESLHGLITLITGVSVQEKVPDLFLEQADDIELIDVDPKVLLNRLQAGKIYPAIQAELAKDNFFQLEKLTQLREIALQQSTQHLSQLNAKKGQQVRHFIVAISEAPSSENAIRWAYRQAKAFGSPWTAVHVARIGSSVNPIIQNHLELAQKLGAHIVVIHGNSVSDTLISFIKQSKVSNLIIGKHVQRTWHSIWTSTLEDKVLDQIPDVDIQIIPNQSGNNKKKIWQIFLKTPDMALPRHDVGLALTVLLLVTALNYVLTYFSADNSLKIMMYFVGIIIVSRLTTGYFLGLLTTLISVFIFDLLFVEPFYSITFYREGYAFVFVMMFITAGIVSSLTSKVTEQMTVSVSAAYKSQILSDLSLKLMTDMDPKKLSEITIQSITSYFKQDVGFYYSRQKFVGNKHLIRYDDVPEVVQWVWHHGLPAGSGTDTLTGKQNFYLPIVYQGNTLAILVGEGNKFNTAERSDLQGFITPLSLALKNYYLRHEAQKNAYEKLDTRLKNDLLQSVSHDLRTPLTSILASSELLLKDHQKSDQTTKLIKNINQETNWLMQMIENILTVTRLQQNTLELPKKSELLEELLLEAVDKFKWFHSQPQIVTNLPDEVIWVQADGRLFQQMILNVLDNAIKYGGKDVKIEINVSIIGEKAHISLQNNGQPFSKKQLIKINKQNRPALVEQNDHHRGLGIGLFLCQTIAKLHGGQLLASNWEHGAKIILAIPAELDDNYD